MPKSCAGRQQKRTSKQQTNRAAKDFAISVQNKQKAARAGITLSAAQTRNAEIAAATAERKTITKEKRQRRKAAKAAVKDAALEAKATQEMQRAVSAADRERRERQAAAAAAAAARKAAA